MNYDDLVEASASSNNKINWTKVIVKPLICGMIFGTGVYITSLILKSPICQDLIGVAKESVKK